MQQTNKQTSSISAVAALLPLRFALRHSKGVIGAAGCSKQANRFLASAGWEAKANRMQSACRVLLARPWPPSWARTELRRSL